MGVPIGPPPFKKGLHPFLEADLADTLTKTSALDFVNTVASGLVFVAIFTMRSLAPEIAMVLVKAWLKVRRINAASVAAFVVHVKTIRNWANKIFIRHAVCRSISFGIGKAHHSVTKAAYASNPFPASCRFVELNFGSDSLNERFPFFEHKKNPTRPAKVKSAERRPQSRSRLENEVLSFFGHFKAASTLTPMSV